jgi:hypothetical protein
MHLAHVSFINIALLATRFSLTFILK